MPNLQEVFLGGYFTSAGVAVNVPLTFTPDYFEILNFTQMGTVQNPGVIVRAAWQTGFPAGNAYNGTKGNGTSTIHEHITTSDGFTLVQTEPYATPNSPLPIPQYGPLVAIAGVSNATPPIVTTGNTTGLVDGTVVRLSSTVGARQLGGMTFSIDTIVASTSFNLAFGVAMGSVATGGNYSVQNFPDNWAPGSRLITNITQANQAVIKFSVAHPYVVGDKIQILVGKDYGMTEINGKVGKVTAINTTTNTVTVNINSSGFTGFTFPIDANYPLTFAQAVPVGEIPTITSGVTANDAINGIQIGTAVVGAVNDVIYWRAWKAFEYFPGALPTFP